MRSHPSVRSKIPGNGGGSSEAQRTEGEKAHRCPWMLGIPVDARPCYVILRHKNIILEYYKHYSLISENTEVKKLL